MSGSARSDLRRIFAAAVEAVEPGRLVKRVVDVDAGRLMVAGPGDRAAAPPIVLRGHLGVFGAGKAATAMAAAVEQLCVDHGRVKIGGAVIAPPGAPRGDGKIRVLAGEHPIPGRRSAESTARLLQMMAGGRFDAFLFLLSGGASSLLAAPLAPLALSQKQEVTRLLLRCGAAIDEINTVRKHLSSVKGGRLLRLADGRPVVSLIISDVMGDDPATIGSGPTVADATTYDDALEVLRRYELYQRCPSAALDVLERGRRGEIPETVRPGSAESELASPLVIGSNATACAAAAQAAARLGYDVRVRSTPLGGETVDSARRWFQSIVGARGSGRRCCFIAGGETTVSVRGDGLGGRNQEFALALVELARGCDVTLLSAGTDGIDGPTEAAGAFVDGATLVRSERLGIDPRTFLAANDSFNFFRRLGDLLITGPTGTNVMDLKIALFDASSAP